MIGMLLSAVEQSQGKDHITFTITPITNGSQTRIKLEEGVLKAAGMGAMMGVSAASEMGAPRRAAAGRAAAGVAD